MNNIIIEKKHRLDLACYTGLTRVSFTLCIKNREAVFIRRNIVKEFITVLANATKKYSCINWVYLFMPDHLHYILEGTKLEANLWKATVLFKQITGYWFTKNLPNIKWQKDFFDYVHRRDADLKQHIFYILDNPVRKQIAKKWQDYPYKGSLDSDLHDIVTAYWRF